ncbi:MAG: exodeoxyribonuclease VII small subunit [Clostridia bacterium]|nr:exodeoxyribonuclease VII small subunit [Clostridia bacterium]
MNHQNESMTFEAAMQRLEEVTRLLEQPDTPLDMSLELYKEGIELIKFCNGMLDSAQQKVTVINASELPQ